MMQSQIDDFFQAWRPVNESILDFKQKSYYDNTVSLCGHELLPEIFQLIVDCMGPGPLLFNLRNSCQATRRLTDAFGLDLMGKWWNSMTSDQCDKMRYNFNHSRNNPKILIGSLNTTSRFRLNDYDLKRYEVKTEGQWNHLMTTMNISPRKDIIEFTKVVNTWPKSQIFYIDTNLSVFILLSIPCGIAANGFLAGIRWSKRGIEYL
jgi:hypothetical protein